MTILTTTREPPSRTPSCKDAGASVAAADLQLL